MVDSCLVKHSACLTFSTFFSVCFWYFFFEFFFSKFLFLFLFCIYAERELCVVRLSCWKDKTRMRRNAERSEPEPNRICWGGGGRTRENKCSQESRMALSPSFFLPFFRLCVLLLLCCLFSVLGGGAGWQLGLGSLGEDNLEIDSFGFFPFCLMLLLLPPFALPFKCLYRWQWRHCHFFRRNQSIWLVFSCVVGGGGRFRGMGRWLMTESWNCDFAVWRRFLGEGRFNCDGKWANAIWLSRLLTRIRKKSTWETSNGRFLPLKSPSRGRLELWKGPFGAWLSLLPSGFMKNPRERRAKTNYTIKNPFERWAWTAKESWTPICPWGNSDKVKIDQKLQFQRLFSMFGAFNGFVDLPLIPWSTFGCILLDFLAQMSPKSQFCVRWSSIRSLARQSRSFCSLMCISEPKWPIKKTIAVWTRPKLLKCTVYWALQWILAPFLNKTRNIS